MQAKDVMTEKVITVDENTALEELAGILLAHRISAVPVIDAKDRLVGIVSEGDLTRQPEPGSDRQPSWWLTGIANPGAQAIDYLKSQGVVAKHIMTREVVSITVDTELSEIARILEENHIKRVPVMRDSSLVGIVSRANLLHGLATADLSGAPSHDDRQLRATILNQLQNEIGVLHGSVNVTVSDSIVRLWGMAVSAEEREAICLAAERTPGVSSVKNHLSVLPPFFQHWKNSDN